MTKSEALSHIAELAHNGGLADLSESDVLRAIRTLTVQYWSRTGGPKGAANVRTAVAALNQL